MRFLATLAGIVLFAFLLARAVDYEQAAQAHLIRVPDHPKRSVLENRAASQRANLAHARYVCRRGAGPHQRWACWASSSVIRANGQGWLRREFRETMNLLRRPAVMGPHAAICLVFGGYCSQALRVASCETGGTFSVFAVNGQYLGLFQMGSVERRMYGHGRTPLEQARAAYRYFVASGRDWSPWACKP